MTDGKPVTAIISHERAPAEDWASDSSVSSFDGESPSEPEDPMTLTTELEERFSEVKHIIGCLYKLSIVIQSPASRDRIERCGKIIVEHYKYFDVAHVSEKFPLAPQYLIDRLGNANTKRRQFFQYLKKHHDKIALYIDAPVQLRIDQPVVAVDLETKVQEADVVPAVKIDCATIGQSVIAKTVNTQTTVSTFVERPTRPTGGSVSGQSQISHGTSVGDDAHTKLCIPAPPRPGRALDGEPFECPYCFSMIVAEDSRSWMHVSVFIAVTCAKNLSLGNMSSAIFVLIFAPSKTAPSPTSFSGAVMTGSPTKSMSIAASGSVMDAKR